MSPFIVLILASIICALTGCNRIGLGGPPSPALGSPRDASDSLPGGHLDRSGKQAPRPDRDFVRAWQIKDLRRELYRMGAGRSFVNGKELFTIARCDQCHRLNQVGGALGPDLTGIAQRNSRAVILRETIEPSKQISETYQSHIIATLAGRVHQGIVVRQDAESIDLASDPSRPDQLLNIRLADIEEMTPSPVSMMPKDLLNTLTQEEILNLLAYIESGGQEDHPAFDPIDE